jgi:hypothetical protein
MPGFFLFVMGLLINVGENKISSLKLHIITKYWQRQSAVEKSFERAISTAQLPGGKIRLKR